ncbi:MAG: endonuclease/exonuclease/phosphatase family metal-dependent hydrolase [Planctomycetota bacterium]|jgi:endonuclease/exonuclease/phosphatase family metal-dependent hydrolase
MGRTTMNFPSLIRTTLALLLGTIAIAQSKTEPIATPATIPIPKATDLSGSFTFRMCVRMSATSKSLPTLAANKAWEEGEVRDYTTNNAYGIGRESGKRKGFAISVLPDGAWTWNAGDGRRRIDHRPEASDQGIADGRWHEVGFAIDRALGVAHLYHDGRRVALHDLQGVGSLLSDSTSLQLGSKTHAVEVSAPRFNQGAMLPDAIRTDFLARFGNARVPAKLPQWDGRPLRVLAWNIWHGGRRKGRDEGVQRVVEVIQECNADIVLMQETYGSGPRISGRLGYDYFLRSSNLSVMSRFPIVDTHRLASGFRFGGVSIQLRPGQTIQAYSLWIDYLPSVQKQLAANATAEQLQDADAKTRGMDMQAILKQLLPHLAKTPDTPVLVGGDFNSGSHLDWTHAASSQPNHQDLVVNWPVSRAMAEANFVDTYRTAHPDPVAKPGLTWSPEFLQSHQDRIDYVYAHGDTWRVLDSRVLSTHPRGWPSDHAAAFTSIDLIPEAEAERKTIKVMSYNIHYGDGMDKKRDLPRIARAIRDHAPDLVGLQEIGNEAMATELGRLTDMAVVFGPSKGSRTAYGDAILSRHPFKWVANHAIPSASSSRYQAMAVDVDLSAVLGADQKVRLINTHFDWLDTIGSREARLASVRLIEKAFCTDADLPVILTGDLNAKPSSQPMKRLQEAGWSQGNPTKALFSIGSPPDRQIDYVLVKPKHGWIVHRTYIADEPIASDHRPVVMILERTK